MLIWHLSTKLHAVISRLLIARKIMKNEANRVTHQNISEALQCMCLYKWQLSLGSTRIYIEEYTYRKPFLSGQNLQILKRTHHHSRLVSESKQSSGFCAEVLGCGRGVTLAKDSVVTSDVERV
jgi:hypothetical protein